MMNTDIATCRFLLLLPLFTLLACGSVGAQTPVDDAGNPLEIISVSPAEPVAADSPVALYTTAELEQLVGPYALQPDDLLAIILPASTYPLEIVLAARFLEQLQVDSELTPDESWDESIIALLNYPEILQQMNAEIESTWQLGEAVIGQQADVLAAIETFRGRAYAAGNLVSDQYQNVVVTEETIEITPVDEKVVYVPYYVVEEVIVEQPVAVYHYYPTPRPVYYYPYPVGHHFHSPFFWGVTTAFSIHWSSHYLHVFHPSYHHHPYYGHSYYSGYHYRRPSLDRFNRHYVNNSFRAIRDREQYGSYWRPQRHSGSRPSSSAYRNYYGGDSSAQQRFDEAVRNRTSYGSYRSGASQSFSETTNNRPRSSNSDLETRLLQRNSPDSNRSALTRSAANSGLPNTNTAALTAPGRTASTPGIERRQPGTRVARPSPSRSSSSSINALRNDEDRSASNRSRSTRSSTESRTTRPQLTRPENRQALTAQPQVRNSTPSRSRATQQRSQQSAPVVRRQESREARRPQTSAPPQRAVRSTPPRRVESQAPARGLPERKQRQRSRDPQ